MGVRQVITGYVHVLFTTYIVSDKTGINALLIQKEQPLSVVLPKFLKWVHITTKEVSETVGTPHHPGRHYMKYIQTVTLSILNVHFTVLVAHNGFRFDFPVLLAEVERRPKQLSLSTFRALSIHFSDTLVHLKKVEVSLACTCTTCIFKDIEYFFKAKKDGYTNLKSVRKFGMEDLFNSFFPEETYNGTLFSLVEISVQC